MDVALALAYPCIFVCLSNRVPCNPFASLLLSNDISFLVVGHPTQPSQQNHNSQQHSSSSYSSSVTGSSRQQTITIRDTPSPAVSVITISDSDDEAGGEGFICFQVFSSAQIRPFMNKVLIKFLKFFVI